MHTVRRLYLYTVAFLSLEVVLWGIIGLLRSYLKGGQQVVGTVRLAESLSFLLVGLPVFLVHGWLAQRSAARDPTERSSNVRAIFLFTALLVTLLPALSNFLAILNRGLLSFFGIDPTQALWGGDQTDLENLVAIMVNLLGAALVLLLLKADWGKPLLGAAHITSRQLYRLFWLVAGLALSVFGLSLIFLSLLSLAGRDARDPLAGLPDGLSLLLVGAPVWFFASRRIESSLSETPEQRSRLRLMVTYSLAFAGLSALLLCSGLILNAVLGSLISSGQNLAGLLEEIRRPVSIAVPLGAVWAYYQRQLQAERRAGISPARHERFHRLYKAVFAFFGLIATITSLQVLLEIGLVAALGRSSPAGEPSRALLPPALACLLVGFPVWLFFWRSLQAEAGDSGEAGDRARASLARKAYLYGVLFLGVAGLMVNTGQLIFQLLQSALGDPPENLLQNALPGLKNFLLFALIVIYHGWVLRRDAHRSERSLAKRRALFPVLVLVPDEGDFAEKMVSALEYYLPRLPIAVHPVSSGAPDESLSAAKAVILPFEILAKPPEALRLWLQSFAGERLVVPLPVENWHWVAGSRFNNKDPFLNAALAILELVEGARRSEE